MVLLDKNVTNGGVKSMEIKFKVQINNNNLMKMNDNVIISFNIVYPQ